MPLYTMLINAKDKHRLEKLCVAMNLSPKRGKSIAIRRLINQAKIQGTTVDLDELPNKESVELLRQEFSNLIRLGGNLNQFVHLLHIRRLRLDFGEDDELVVEADYLMALMNELFEEVDKVNEAIVSFVRKY